MSTPPPDDVITCGPGTSDRNDGQTSRSTRNAGSRWPSSRVAQLMVILDATIVNIALPQAQAALGISDANRQWMVTAYALPFGALLLLGGRIADYVGRKKILIIALSGFAIASAVGGAAQVGWQLFIARAFQGAFAAMLAPAALSLVTVTFHAAKERAKAFAVFGAISGGGAAIGLLLGGVLTEYASWRWCLFVNIPIAIIAVLAAIPVLKESKVEGGTHYDIPGAVLATAGLGALVWACTQPAEHGWGSINTLGWLAVAVVLLAGVRAGRAEVEQPAAADADRGEPEPGRCLRGRPAGRRRPVRGLPVPDLLPAGGAAVHPDPGRASPSCRSAPASSSAPESARS